LFDFMTEPLGEVGGPQALVTSSAFMTLHSERRGPTGGGSPVLIGGMPAARVLDLSAHGGSIAIGLPTVLIGDAGSAQQDALKNAARNGAPSPKFAPRWMKPETSSSSNNPRWAGLTTPRCSRAHPAQDKSPRKMVRC
jgi:uncharacterized Zn-binding protein involved in type VI secretion